MFEKLTDCYNIFIVYRQSENASFSKTSSDIFFINTVSDHYFFKLCKITVLVDDLRF